MRLFLWLLTCFFEYDGFWKRAVMYFVGCYKFEYWMRCFVNTVFVCVQ
jgi:hypothetical protein